MATPLAITFTSDNGEVIDLNSAAYRYQSLSAAFSAPPAEVDIISRTQAGGVSIPYAAVGEREFELRLRISGMTAEETQARLNTLIGATYITLGSNEPRFGVLSVDGFGASSTPRLIRCAAKGVSRRWRGLIMEAVITFTSESGIWYAPDRITLPLQTVALGDDVPVVGINAGAPGDPLPWAFGSGRPHVEVTFNYDGTSHSRSLEARVTGPAERPLFRRGNVILRFEDDVPAGTTLVARMASGARHQLVGAADEVLREFVATGDSFQIPLAPGTNTLWYSQRNQIDGAYNTVSFSYREEYLSAGV